VARWEGYVVQAFGEMANDMHILARKVLVDEEKAQRRVSYPRAVAS
jgi:hypothetical protein